MSGILLRIITRSLKFYRRDYFIQVIIISLLASIITGSLLTGYSVRMSLRKNASERVGNADILISSGLRFFDLSLSGRMGEITGLENTAIFQTDGYCQNFETGATALNTAIYGITDDFFRFQGIDTLQIPSGMVAINSRLAHQLGVSQGGEIIIRFRDADPIPANAPFAPDKRDGGSLVMKVAMVLEPEVSGNFSLEISQVTSMSVFMNLEDIQKPPFRINRMIVDERDDISIDSLAIVLKKYLLPADVGLRFRYSPTAAKTEILSDRIFIDSAIVHKILDLIPEGYPVLTYLANKIEHDGSETPYSFISGIPGESGMVIGDNEIVINRWLANDLDLKTADEITLTWYEPSGKLLEEKSGSFYISDIIDENSPFSDPLLMPEFPGIAGSSTCSSWDAGIPILMDRIRDKDEDYWDVYKGTPKGFINYETAKSLWGNNFGPATAIRFPESRTPEELISLIAGNLDPADSGFRIEDIRYSGEEAASESVDFGTLFLSLGIFMIVSCLILLSFAVSMFFDTKKEQIRTYFSIGFKNKSIAKLLFTETAVILLIGTIPGIFLGHLFNILIIAALNSVWTGATQTNTLAAAFGFVPLFIGFLSTILITLALISFRLKSFLKKLREGGDGKMTFPSSLTNLILLGITFSASIILMLVSLFQQGPSTIHSFISGVLLFTGLILALRQYYLGIPGRTHSGSRRAAHFSRKYYTLNPSHIITPVIFISAGIFAIMITGANRKVLSDEMLLNEGGTGGYLFWAESAVPVKEDLDLLSNRKDLGLDEPGLENLEILQVKRLDGDDASCLNLNYIKAPPLLGIRSSEFIKRNSFSFATTLNGSGGLSPWEMLNQSGENNFIYGIADQTVLQWGLKLRTGDTLIYKTEAGVPVGIIICGGLQSSIFQGHILIGERNFEDNFPSVPGSSVFLIDGEDAMSDTYKSTLNDRLSGYGLSVVPASEKLMSFFIVTNTYLDVFAILGVFGMILGIAGLGFILLRNYDQRQNEFAIMVATGYTTGQIRKLIISDQVIILAWGIITGSLSALAATIPTLRGGNEIPGDLIAFMIIAIAVTGLSALFISVNRIKDSNLVTKLRRE